MCKVELIKPDSFVQVGAPTRRWGRTKGQNVEPESQTKAPESQIKAPESQTRAPESQTEAPESRTEAKESRIESLPAPGMYVSYDNMSTC